MQAEISMSGSDPYRTLRHQEKQPRPSHKGALLNTAVFPQHGSGNERVHTGIKYPRPQLSNPYENVSSCANHDCSFLSCGTGPPWWKQSINSQEAKYSPFKWSSTWPWWEKTAETKDIASWWSMLYLVAHSYLLKIYCLTWWTRNYHE